MDIFILLSITLCIFVGPASLTTTSNIGMDNIQMVQHIRLLERTVSDLQSMFKTHEEKQAAVLSSILSKLVSTTDELSNVNGKLHLLENKYNSTLLELSSVKTELKTLEKDHSSLRAEFQLVSDSLKSTSEELGVTKSNLLNLQIKTNATALNIHTLHEQFRSSESSISNNTVKLKMMNASLISTSAEVLSAKSQLSTMTGNVTELKSAISTVRKDELFLSLNENNTQNVLQSIIQDMSTIRNQSLDISLLIRNLTSAIAVQQVDVAYEARLTSDYVESSGNQPLNFSTVYNRGEGYNESSGIFTAPVSGTYMFWGHIMNNNDKKELFITLFNGEQVIGRGYVSHGITYGVASFTTAAYLNKENKVWLTNTGGRYNYSLSYRGGKFSNFGGALLRHH